MVNRKASKLRRTPHRTARRRTGRSDAIVDALRRLMLKQGYAQTSLSDLARSAGMSVSHLLYYFPSKEAALEELASRFSSEVLEGVTSDWKAPPEQRIRRLVDHVYADRLLPRGELAIVIEMISLSSHHPELKKIQLRYARGITRYLIDLFRHLPRAPGLSPEDAAQIAAAVWMGLIVDSQYMRGLNRRYAAKLFERALRELGGVSSPRR